MFVGCSVDECVCEKLLQNEARARTSQIVFLRIEIEQGEVSSKKRQQDKGLLCRRVAIGSRARPFDLSELN